MNRECLSHQLIRHEGMALRPYLCPSGKVTIGVGRNLEDVGVSETEALVMLDNDLERVETELKRLIPAFDALSEVRQMVLGDMCFNLGASRFAKFRKMLAAVEAEDFEEASRQMLDSKWASQVGPRARRLAGMMAADRLPEA